MKNKIVSNKIAILLSKNVNYLKENTFEGKLGISLFLFQCSRILSKPHYSDLAFDVLDYSINKELLLEINKAKLDFMNGVSGIGIFIIFMIEEKYFETDIDELVTHIDKRIFLELETLTRVNKKENIPLLLSLLAYLKYRKIKVKFLNEYEELLNQEAILLIEISIQFSVQNFEYELHSVFLSLINEIITIETDPYLAGMRDILHQKENKRATKKKHFNNELKIQIITSYLRPAEEDCLIGQHSALTLLLKNQDDVTETFQNLVRLGLLSLGEDNMLMELFWNFSYLDAHFNYLRRTSGKSTLAK